MVLSFCKFGDTFIPINITITICNFSKFMKKLCMTGNVKSMVKKPKLKSISV